MNANCGGVRIKMCGTFHNDVCRRLDRMAGDESEKGVCSPRAWVVTRWTGSRATSCGTRTPINQ
jgi:hypothetical protein